MSLRAKAAGGLTGRGRGHEIVLAKRTGQCLVSDCLDTYELE